MAEAARRLDIEIPYSPRKLQAEYHARAQRHAILVCHRRFGKTVCSVNDLVEGALTCALDSPRVAYIAPLYRQAKQVAWDFTKKYATVIPGAQANESELRIDFPNGSRMTLYGADNPDSLRGIYLDRVVLDEYAQMPGDLWETVIRPTLSDRKGRATFIGTPQGHNEFYDLYHKHKDDPDWYVRLYRASETGYVDRDELRAAQRDMSPERYSQEYECSWSAGIIGAFYAQAIELAERQSRITKVFPEPSAKVETWWDLGIGDATAIWFVQRVGIEIRVIDFYESTGEPLSHYAGVIFDKKREGKWILGDCIVPHDAKQRSLDTGSTRIDTLKGLDLHPVVIAQHRVEDRIEAVRKMLANTWFDAEKCAHGLKALRQYRSQYDEKNRVFSNRPLHDWASHASDAFGYGAMHKPRKHGWTPIVYGPNGVV